MRTFLFLLILAAVTNTATGTTKGKGKRGKRGNGSDSNICKNLTYEQQLETTDKWIGLWFTCTRNGGSRYAYNPLSDEEPLWHTYVIEISNLVMFSLPLANPHTHTHTHTHMRARSFSFFAGTPPWGRKFGRTLLSPHTTSDSRTTGTKNARRRKAASPQ